MIEARHSSLHETVFDAFVKFLLRWHFREIRITGQYQPEASSTLLIANHFSWWDGFFAWYLNRQLIGRRFHVMMLEEQLRPRPFFQKVGAFGIRPGKREVIEALRYASQLLRTPGNLLVMFPQGLIQSQHTPKLHFRKGVEAILRQSEGAADILFCAALTDYYSAPRPSLTIHLSRYDMPWPDIRTLEAAFNAHIAEARQQQDSLWSS